MAAPRAPSLALAPVVQVRCRSNLEVVKYDRFWGEGDQALGLLPEGECWQPLGRLEFILDPDGGGGGGE
jgi:hypothetical protein